MLQYEHAGVHLVQFRNREQRRVGVTTAEGDDVGVRAQSQQLADG
jgi:hypothetical protein